jgi:hypothetical protein
MFKSKHSGWTWDLKRTPFGGGGGGFISDIGNSISNAVSDVGSALASIDPGPTIGSGLASVDNAVNQLPGGWLAPAAVTALIAAPELAPMVSDALSAGVSTQAGQDAFFTALANGASSSDAISAGLSADAAAAGGATGAGVADAVTQTPGANAVLSAPDVTVPSLTPASSGSFGSITAPATGSGAIPGAGATTLGGGGLTGALPSGVVVGDGTLGTTMGATYMATDSGGIATDLLGNPIPASSTGVGGFAPDTSLSASDIATNAKRLQSIAKLLNGSSGTSISGKSAPTASQWNQQAISNLTQATPQQFGGLYEMNKSPFTFTNPLANALAGGTKQPGIYDVSGTPGTALNTAQQNQIYSSLLRSA